MSHLIALALKIPQLVMEMKYITDVHKTYLITPALQFKGENNWFPEVKGFWEWDEPKECKIFTDN